MNYQQFLEAIRLRVKGLLDPTDRVKISSTLKNNDTLLFGINIRKKNQNAAPTIYMEEFFARYKEGADIDELVEELLMFHSTIEIPRLEMLNIMNDFSEVAPQIMYKLIQVETNPALLGEIPYRRWNDLAITYYVLLDTTKSGCVTMPITKIHLDTWGVTEVELYDLASINTPVKLPHEFKNLEQIFPLPFQDLVENNEYHPLYILSNKAFNYGAVSILYPGVMEEIREELGEDFYIIPSSVHEIIILKKSIVGNNENLETMIREINFEALAPEDVLNYKPYLYSKEKGIII